MSRSGRTRQLELAVAALAALVREEYPSDLSLAEIARRWGHGLTTEHLAALAALDTEMRFSGPQEPIDVGEIEP